MTDTVRSTDPDAPPALVEDLESAEVVVFVSNLTDIRSVRAWLERNGVDYRVVAMGMGSAAQRDRFHQLRDWTGWPLLPQVFIQGAFVGGAEELFASDYARAFE